MTVRNPLFWLSCVSIVIYAELNLEVKYAWRYLEYQYDSDWEERDAIQSGVYYFRKNYPFDVEVAPDGRMFITVRREFGVPSSLNTVTNVTGEGGGPLLTAYPNWSWTKPDNCDNIIGAYRMVQDECNRLWVLDNGRFGEDLICPPKLLAFDLKTDSLVQRLDIPEDLVENAHGLGNPIIDTVGENCSETDIYITDSQGNGILVWNGKTTWRIESPYFEPSPGGEKFSVFGVDFDLSRGIVGMAITREVPVKERLLYFRPLSSFTMHHVKAVDLHRHRNEPEAIEYFTEESPLPSQSVVQAFSSQGILFFTSVSEYNILCWNRHKPFVPENIVELSSDHKTMRWASGIKVYQRDGQETLYVLTNRVPEIETGKINFTRTNFRVLTGDVQKLVAGTSCELQSE